MTRQFIDRTGHVYGSLTVQSRSARRPGVYWKCQCSCGKETVVSTANLCNGNTISCGCAWERSVKKEMIGKKFGSLTVLSQAESKTYGKATFAMYDCLCDCGGKITTLGMSLRNGDTISCGCSYKAAGALRIKPEEHKKFVRNLCGKRRRAARLNAVCPFDVEFFKLIESEAYMLSELRTKLTGVRHEVDHVIPLQSKIVCGLHNEYNFAVITATENNRKGNRRWPDMP